MHPNCRSKTRAYMGEEIEKTLKRRARNPVTGKNEIIGNMSYKEWLNKNKITYGKDTIDKAYKMAKNKVYDSKQYERYLEIFGKKEIGTLENFVNIKYNNIELWNYFKTRARTKNCLQEQLAFIINGEKLFIPKDVKFDTVKTIAGSSTDKPIFDIERLITNYGGTADEWRKRAGKVTSDKYIFDIHWYEKDAIQYEPKLKTRKERKK